MPVVKQITLYRFDELSEKAQEKVIERFRTDEILFFDGELIIESIYDKYETQISDMDIEYSGFWSQGDGASFTGTLDSDWLIENLLPDNLKELVRYVGCHFTRKTYMYVHENTVSSDLRNVIWADHIEDNERLSVHMSEKHMRDIEDCIEEYRRDICHEIYSLLEEQYEYTYSEENIRELIEINDYLFHENGDLE